MDVDLDEALRSAVLRHGRAERRRVYPPVLHAGRPWAGDAAVRGIDVPTPPPDLHLRVELVEAIVRADLRAGRPPLVWVTRPFAHTEDDLAWATAARAAGGELGVALELFGVSKRSWHDPLTDRSRVWRRPIRVRR